MSGWTEKESMNSFLKNSIVIPRDGDKDLFVWEDGRVFARLDGYAVVPVEQLSRLVIGKVSSDETTPLIIQ